MHTMPCLTNQASALGGRNRDDKTRPRPLCRAAAGGAPTRRICQPPPQGYLSHLSTWGCLGAYTSRTSRARYYNLGVGASPVRHTVVSRFVKKGPRGRCTDMEVPTSNGHILAASHFQKARLRVLKTRPQRASLRPPAAARPAPPRRPSARSGRLPALGVAAARERRWQSAGPTARPIPWLRGAGESSFGHRAAPHHRLEWMQPSGG